jgi:hypothetical protein
VRAFRNTLRMTNPDPTDQQACDEILARCTPARWASVRRARTSATAKASVRLAATPLELRLINCHFDRRENLVINNDAFDCLDLRFLAPLEMTTCSELP